ncbi:MAG: bifunctional riboflavin kinase/FAD synthetase [Melioribacteraceae bacterium]|nr:bifunctional riboflavin kinase/FAD synthetase [Melioribacteraceae bacterium]
MKIFTDISQIEKKKVVLTIGTFDGLHLGHIDILKSVIQKSEEYSAESLAVTFEPHPRSVVSKDSKIKLLTTLDEKKEIFTELGIENLLIINFTEEFASLSSREFIETYLLSKLNVSEIVVGYDHRFGKNRDGDESKLREIGNEFGFKVSSVSAVKVDDYTISSTKIRNALSLGDLKTANKYLGRFYCFYGDVIKGAGRGRKLGYPTANIDPEKGDKLIPKPGVYLITSNIEGKDYFGLMNIGSRPTFNDIENMLVEVHLLDFNDDIYGKHLRLDLIDRLRDEKKFASKDELMIQIKNDEKKSNEIINLIINSG